ncbi:MAG TPA: ABC transporter permease, partial [Xanthobacteraceae bacterium]|nr:ABC transporter permease [Xanthobacteraceae bacterium]
MRYGVRGLVLRVILIIAFLCVWELAVHLFSIPAFILPPPTNIFIALYRGFASALYFSHIGVTLAETFMGFALGSALALSIGIAVAMSRRVEYYLYPFIVMFQA